LPEASIGGRHLGHAGLAVRTRSAHSRSVSVVAGTPSISLTTSIGSLAEKSAMKSQRRASMKRSM
jgi:hypothetical protein